MIGSDSMFRLHPRAHTTMLVRLTVRWRKVQKNTWPVHIHSQYLAPRSHRESPTAFRMASGRTYGYRTDAVNLPVAPPGKPYPSAACPPPIQFGPSPTLQTTPPAA